LACRADQREAAMAFPQSGGFGFPSKNGFVLVLVFDFVLFDLFKI